MIGALVSLVSLAFSAALMAADVVAGTLPITGATTTTPVVVTSAAHGVPLGRVVHGGIADVGGMTELNGQMWVLTPLDADSFSVTTFDAQGNVVPSVGVGTYAGGGTISYAFPDYAILLGRRNKNTATMVTSPRVLMIPTRGRTWGFEPFGGADPNLPTLPPERGTAEAQSRKQSPQIATQFTTFEVYVNGCAPDFGAAGPDPDFADFDATQRLVHMFYEALFDGTGGRARVLSERWPSQEETQGAMTQRGQQWCGIVEFQVPVTKKPLEFVPIGTSAQIIVQPDDPGPTDPIEIDIPPA